VIPSVALGEVRGHGHWLSGGRLPGAVYSLAAARRPVKAGAMGFFDDLSAPEPAPPRRHHPWEPPEAEFPGIVPIDTLLLGRTDQVAVAVTGLSAFSAGIEIFLTARIRPSSGHPAQPPTMAGKRRLTDEALPLTAAGQDRAIEVRPGSAARSEPRMVNDRDSGRRSGPRRS
jgi:hypothetical protein